MYSRTRSQGLIAIVVVILTVVIVAVIICRWQDPDNRWHRTPMLYRVDVFGVIV